MTRRQRIVWIPVGTGIEKGRLHVAVAVVPTLTGDGDETLADFPDFARWPRTILQAKPDLLIRRDDGTVLTLETKLESHPVNGHWRTAFPDTTAVFTAAPDKLEGRQILSYAVTHVENALHSALRESVLSSTSARPTAKTLLESSPQLASLASYLTSAARQTRLAQLQALRSEQLYLGVNYLDPQELDLTDSLVLAQEYTTVDDEDPQLVVDPPELDFHKLVGLFGAHPALMRIFGLIVDLSVRLPLPALLPDGVVHVALSPNLKASLPTVDVKPGVRSVLARSTDTFMPAPDHDVPSDVLLGRAQFDQERFTFHTADGEAMAQKLLNLVSPLGRFAELDLDGPLPPGALAPVEVPSVHSTGITVARAGRAELLKNNLDRRAELIDQYAASTGSPFEPVLAEQDLVRGLRLDVKDDVTDTFHPLQARTGFYRFPNAFRVNVTDEAILQAPPKAPASGSSTNLYHHERVAVWSGWSLTVPRPWRHIGLDDQPADAPTAPDDAPVAFEWEVVPGSLPRLRYGRTYWVRGRGAYITGDGLSPELPDDTSLGVSPPIPFRRYQPVPHPTVLLRHPKTTGETVDVVVIRSNEPGVLDPDRASNQRHVAPAAGTFESAEWHGALDEPDPVPGRKLYDEIARRDGYHAAGMAALGGTPDPRGDGSFYFDRDTFDDLWLVDPIAGGATFSGLPGGEVLVPFGPELAAGYWLDRLPFRLVVGGSAFGQGSSVVGLSSADRTLTVAIEQGEHLTVDLSAFPDPDRIDHLQVPELVDPDHSNDDYRRLVADGRQWLTSPPQSLTLVHATRRPPLAPELWVDQGDSSWHVRRRTHGATWVELAGQVTYHPHSTEALELHASWREILDEGPGTAAPRVIEVTATPFAQLTGEAASPLAFGGTQDFGDTKHRRVLYRADGRSAYTDKFTVKISGVSVTPGAVVTLTDPDDPEVEGVAARTVVVQDQDGQRRTVAGPHTGGGDYELDPATGQLTWLTDPATIDIRFVAGSIMRPGANTPDLQIPATARPAPPEVDFVVPVFEWERDELFRIQQSTRRGNKLRVWLKRPWFVSGQDERLAVVLHDDSELQPFPHVSEWGADPAFDAPSDRSKDPLATRHLPGSTTEQAIPAGYPRARVNLATYEIHHEANYDAERDQYFVDIDIDPDDMYFPFVRLVLARFQPEGLVASIDDPGSAVTKDVRLSDVVTCTFTQLAPDRSATAVRSGDSYHVAMTGYSYQGADVDYQPRPSQVRAFLEIADDALPDDVAWEQHGEVVELSPTLQRDGRTSWSGDLPAPSEDGRFRIVFEEFEIHWTGDWEQRQVGDLLLDFKSETTRVTHTDHIDI